MDQSGKTTYRFYQPAPKVSAASISHPTKKKKSVMAQKVGRTATPDFQRAEESKRVTQI